MPVNHSAVSFAVRDACKSIGAEKTPEAVFGRLSPDQKRRFNARNVMSPTRIQCRVLASGSLVVELSLGEFLNDPMIGVTVFCVGDLAADAPEWDHSLSGVFNTPEEAAGRLAVLNSGGRDRIAALAAA